MEEDKLLRDVQIQWGVDRHGCRGVWPRGLVFMESTLWELSPHCSRAMPPFGNQADLQPSGCLGHSSEAPLDHALCMAMWYFDEWSICNLSTLQLLNLVDQWGIVLRPSYLLGLAGEKVMPCQRVNQYLESFFVCGAGLSLFPTSIQYMPMVLFHNRSPGL